MSAKRYFQLSFVGPVVLPVIILALSGSVLADWAGQICRAALYAGGIPYLVFAVGMILWSQKKDAPSVRRATYLGPALFLPILFAYSTLAIALNGASYRSGQYEMAGWLLIYGFLAAMVVIPLGYGYVGLINLAFVMLRSWGVIEEEPPTAAEGFQNWNLPSIREPASLQTCASAPSPARPEPDNSTPPASPQSDSITPVRAGLRARPALRPEAVSSPPAEPAQWAPGLGQASSPYGFVNWDDERLKGSTMTPPPFSQENQPASAPAAATPSRPVSSNLAASNSFIPARKPARGLTTVKPRTWRDPLVTASLAILAPLIILSAFAFCRHYGLPHRHTSANAPAATSAPRKSSAPTVGP